MRALFCIVFIQISLDMLYIDKAVRIVRSSIPIRAVSWVAPLSQVAATVRVRGVASLAVEASDPVAVAVRVRAYVCPTVVLRAEPLTVRTLVVPP